MSSLTQEQRHQITKQLLFEHPDQPWSLENNASFFAKMIFHYAKLFHYELTNTDLIHVTLMALTSVSTDRLLVASSAVGFKAMRSGPLSAQAVMTDSSVNSFGTDQSFSYDHSLKQLTIKNADDTEIVVSLDEIKAHPFHADGVMFELVFSQLKKVQPMRSAS